MNDDLDRAEYQALRATIRERGTMRLIVIAITFVSWAALVIVIETQFALALMSLVTLLVLAAGFEVAFAAHVGVERIGRFLQVYYERADEARPAWERTAMAFGRMAGPTGGLDPLFTALFVVATVINAAVGGLLSVGARAIAGGGVEPIAYGVLHGVFLWRLLRARHFARGQRARDLAWLEERRATHG